MARSMIKKITFTTLIATAVIVAIIIALTIKSGDNMNDPNSREPISAPDGYIVIDGTVIPPEDFRLLDELGAMFLNALPRNSVDPGYFAEPDRVDDILEQFGKSAAVSMYIAGIRELREIVVMDKIDFAVEARLIDTNGVVYYASIFSGRIELITRDSSEGEVLFDNRWW